MVNQLILLVLREFRICMCKEAKVDVFNTVCHKKT